MPDSLRTTVGQFSSAGGRSQARAVNVRAVEPAPDLSGAERGNLYMLIEVTGSGGGHAALYRQMLNAAQTAFYEAGSTLSLALVQAIRYAHTVLRRANEALPEAGWRAGISCVALQGNELTIAQAGPALVVIGHPKTVDLFPAAPDPQNIPMGGPDRPDPQFFRTAVEPGSMILLAQSDWLKYVPAEALAAATTADSVTLATDYLGQLAGDAELSALLVGVGSVVPEVVEGVGGGPVRRETIGPAGPVARAPGKPPEAEVGRVPEAARLAGEGAQPVEAEAISGASGGLMQEKLLWRLFGRRPPAAPPPEPALPERPVEAAEEEPAKRSLWPLLAAIVIIPLLIAALVLGMWWTRVQTTENKFLELFSGASAAVTEAEMLPDEAMARMRLDAAKQFLEQARALKPGDPRLPELEKKYQENLDRVNHVALLYGVVPLYDFKDSGLRLQRVVSGGDALFVLDLGRQEVSHFVLSEQRDSVTPAPTPIAVQKGQQVDNETVGDLVDMTWVAAVGNQRSKLLVLDTAGGLIGYDATWGPIRLPLADRDKWGYPHLIASYNGNLYIVDTKSDQIWRYRPGEQGYENPPESYFTAGNEVDLEGIQSIAIDGNIWLLYADGRLLRFFLGEQPAFELSGLPDPLNAPTAIAASIDGDQIYVADTGNGRIIEFSKGGKFLRQFRLAQGDQLKEMRDLFLDEAAGAFYILTSDKVYKADLPKPVPTPVPAQ